jgi:gamma-glutamyltranspeptidase
MERRMDDLAPFPIPHHCDTAFLTVVDADRNTVAFINSIFDDFGTGIVSPAAGTAQAIWIDWEAGLLRGGADGRRDGLAAGW